VKLRLIGAECRGRSIDRHLLFCLPVVSKRKCNLLYDRIVHGGTLSETDGVPDPQFALPSTINWMHALALLVTANRIDFDTACRFYSASARREFTPHEENTIFEQLFFALHQLAALEAFRTFPRRADVARVGIVTWYYGVYYAASAMVAAQDGSVQDDHTGTANAWDRHFAARSMAMPPFAFRLSSVLEADVKAQIAQLRDNSQFDLKSPASNARDALGACCAYLSGTAGWYRDKISDDLRSSKEFKALEVPDFRTKRAQELRNARFTKRALGFLHQAVRYRGKANYREALFLGYGSGVETLLRTYLDDLAVVLAGFLTMAGAMVSKRLGNQPWTEFVADVEKKRAFTTSPDAVWR